GFRHGPQVLPAACDQPSNAGPTRGRERKARALRHACDVRSTTSSSESGSVLLVNMVECCCCWLPRGLMMVGHGDSHAGGTRRAVSWAQDYLATMMTVLGGVCVDAVRWALIEKGYRFFPMPLK